MQLLKQGIDSSWGSEGPFQAAGQQGAYDGLLQEAIDLFVTSGGRTGASPGDAVTDSIRLDGCQCASSSKETVKDACTVSLHL